MIAIGCDHAGFQAKEFVKGLLAEQGLQAKDYGCFSEQSVHYPEFGGAVAQAVSESECQRGILICGTGIGMSIVANRYAGVRAALCHDPFTATASREHNDANILVMGARVLSQEQMREIVGLWLNTPFAGGRHAERLAMIDNLGR